VTKGDRVVIAVVTLLVALLYGLLWNRGEGQWLEVARGGEVVARLDLTQNQEFHVRGLLGESVIQIRDGNAAFVDSPCPEKLCVRTGHLHHAGETSVCLPNGISLRVVAENTVYDAMNF